MAIVRMSIQLKIQISNAAMGVYSKRIEDARNAFKFPYDGPTLYDMMMGEWKERVSALPRAFFTMRRQIAIRKIGDITPSDDNLLPLPNPMPFPRGFPAGYDVVVTEVERRDYVLVSLLPSARWQPVIDAATAWKTNYDAIYKQGSDFALSVTKALDAYGSLNAAVKEWPALWELVPDEYKAKMRAAGAKEKRNTTPPDVDLNQLTATIAASKIL